MKSSVVAEKKSHAASTDDGLAGKSAPVRRPRLNLPFRARRHGSCWSLVSSSDEPNPQPDRAAIEPPSPRIVVLRAAGARRGSRRPDQWPADGFHTTVARRNQLMV